MTHLRIELNTTGIEEVPSATITKLYNIVHDDTLDNTSNLVGRLHTAATYQDYIDYLEGLFDGTNDKGPLYIDATKKYLMFEDPEIERVIIAKNIGDGVGLTLSDLSSITELSEGFYGNSTITSANDLQLLTNCTTLTNRVFQGCTNLTSVKTPSSLRVLGKVTFDPSFGGIFRGCSSLTSVTLNEGLEILTCRSFNSCPLLQTIDIPSTVILTTAEGLNLDNTGYNQNRSYGLFQNDTGLTIVTGGENITRLGSGTFLGCSNLESLPDFDFSKITVIGAYCFFDCQKLQLGNLNLSSLTLTNIHYSTFFNCTRLTSITLPSTVTTLENSEDWRGYGVFRGCTALTTVNAPGLLTIGDHAFQSCTSLTSIDLSSCTTIKDSAFNGCTSLNITSGTLLLNLQSLNSYAFYLCINLNIELNLPNLTGSLDIGTFYGTKITKIKSLGSVTLIVGSNNLTGRPFGGCTYLTEIDLSTTTSLTTIGTAVFAGCNNLTTIKLPSSLTSIEGWAFVGNLSQRTYYIYATTPPTLAAANSISSDNGTSMPAAIYVPYGCGNTYKTASVWSTFASVILEMPLS